MKALKQVLFVKDASKAADLWAAENGSKAAWKAAKQLRNTRAGCASRRQRTSILDRDGEEVTEPEQVVEVFRQHYETLGQP
jgi:hypothetical protein